MFWASQVILKGHGIPAHLILKFIYVQILDCAPSRFLLSRTPTNPSHLGATYSVHSVTRINILVLHPMQPFADKCELVWILFDGALGMKMNLSLQECGLLKGLIGFS